MAADFLSTYTPFANDIATQTGLDPSVVLGIIDTETGGGAHVLGNNLFGITPPGGVARYPDVQTAAQAFVNLMQTPRYRGVAAASDPASQAVALVRAGYNTVNPNYASIVANKALNFGKTLGYQGQDAPNVPQTPAPDYNTPAPAPAAPAADPTKQAVADELSGAPPAPAPPASSAADPTKKAVADELGNPPPPLADTGPPAKPPAAPLVGEGFSATGDYVPPQAVPTQQQITAAENQPLPGGGISMRPYPGAAERILEAAKQGWQGTDAILTPAARNVLDQGALGRYIYNPLLDFAGAGLAAGGALFRGGQQAVTEALNPLSPALARDIAALPEAFPTGDYGQPGGPKTAGAARTALNRPVTLEELTSAVRRAGGEEPPPPGGGGGAATGGGPQPSTTGGAPSADVASLNDAITEAQAHIEKTGVNTPERAAAHQALDALVAQRDRLQAQNVAQPSPAEDRVSAGEAPQPQPVGAQATPGADIPDQTNLERARNLRVQINQSALDRAGPGLKDDTAYVTDVPGGTLPPRMLPERDFDPQTALDFKKRYMEDTNFRTAYDANSTARNTGMVDLLQRDAGDAMTLDAARTARREMAPQNFRAFEGEQPVPEGAQRYVDNIQSILAGPEGKRAAVERSLNSVLSRMYDADGNLETAPSQLYGVKGHIDDLLNKAQRPMDAEGNDAAAAQSQLRDLKDQMDNLIQTGAPRYNAYREAYRQASQPVNQQRFLQRYWEGGKKLTNREGNLDLGKVNTLLEDIHKGLTDTKFNLAKSLTDQQIQNIVNVRNELAAKQLRDVQAKVPGSPTYQLFSRAAKTGTGPIGTLMRSASDIALHSAAAYAAAHGVPGLNAALGFYQGAVRPARMVAKAQRQQAKVNALTAARDQELLSQNPLSMY